MKKLTVLGQDRILSVWLNKNKAYFALQLSGKQVCYTKEIQKICSIDGGQDYFRNVDDLYSFIQKKRQEISIKEDSLIEVQVSKQKGSTRLKNKIKIRLEQSQKTFVRDFQVKYRLTKIVDQLYFISKIEPMPELTKLKQRLIEKQKIEKLSKHLLTQQEHQQTSQTRNQEIMCFKMNNQPKLRIEGDQTQQNQKKLLKIQKIDYHINSIKLDSNKDTLNYEVIFGKQKKTERVLSRLKYILQDPNIKNMEVPSFINPQSAYLTCFSFCGRIITLERKPIEKQNRSLMLLGSKSIEQKNQFLFKLLQFNKRSSVSVGIVDQVLINRKFCRSGDKVVKINTKGYLMDNNQCRKILQTGYIQKGDIIGLKISIKQGSIQWKVRNKKLFIYQNECLKDKNIRWVPFVQMRSKYDKIQWL